MSEVPVESAAIGLRRVRLSRILSRIGFGGLIVALVGEAMSWLAPHAWGPRPDMLVSTYLFWLFAWGASYAAWFLERKRPGSIVIGADGKLQIQRGSSIRTLERADVDSAHAVERPEGMCVELALTKGDVFSVRVPSLADADALVDRLGFGPGARRQRIDLGARKRRLLHPLLGMLAYEAVSIAAMPLMIFASIADFRFSSSLMPLAVAIALPLVYRFFRAKAAAPRLEIGDDGFALSTGNHAPRFFAWKEFFGAQLVPNTGNIAMNTVEGPSLVSAVLLDRAQSLAVMHAITRRWTASTAATAMGPRVATFERGGRPIEAWRTELASRIAATGYRGDGVTIDEAESVLRNAAASPDARLGAALALASAGERVRVAEAVAPVADQRLRVALEAVAEGHEEPEVLEAALMARGRLR